MLKARPRRKPRKSIQLSPAITDKERQNFSFGATTREKLLDDLRPVIRALAKGGIRKPKAVAEALNRANLSTACGNKWSERLAVILLGMMFGNDRDIWEAVPNVPKNRRLPVPSQLSADVSQLIGRPPSIEVTSLQDLITPASPPNGHEARIVSADQ